MVIQVCVGSSCHLKGSQDIVELLQKAIENHHLENEITLVGTLCIGRGNRIGVSIQVGDDVYVGITKEKFNEVKEDERVKDFINSASETLDETITTINESETFNKVKENVSNTFENIKNDENVQAGVKKAKKATLSFAKKALRT